jgi:MoxR-like ATPase
MSTKSGNIESTLASLKAIGAWPTASTTQIYEHARANGFSYNGANSTFMTHKVGRGSWNLAHLADGVVAAQVQTQAPVPTPTPKAAPVVALRGVQSVSSDEIYVPAVDSNFIPWGEYQNVKRIVDSRMFFPLYISGMSGNGKTIMVEQACAKSKREYVRVQISPETDEDDLLGGFRLVNGETVFQHGPVIKAMKRGAILLIDELDRGSNKIMCLQGVLEGKPILIKKTGETVTPAPGFNVIATANTKGRGSDDGRYVAAQIIDEAFIERFVASIDQPYPEFATELKIVKKHMTSLQCDDDEFANRLVSWSSVIRATFENEGVDEVVSTRRLCHIVKSFAIFRDRMTAIRMCIARFDSDTREAFLDLYSKIDAQSLADNTLLTAVDEVPF